MNPCSGWSGGGCPPAPLRKKITLKCFFPADLDKLADVSREIVERFDDYFRLAYIDVVEFNGRHVRHIFSDLEERFSAAGPLEGKVAGGADKSFAFTVAYLSFLNYFMLSRQLGATKLFRARDNQEVIAKLVQLFRRGVGAGNRRRPLDW